METLIEVLVSVLKQVPKNPMTPEYIGVQSRGMKQWVTVKLAKKFGICANTHFVFPRQIIDQILNDCQVFNGSDRDLDEDTIFWSIMKQLHTKNSKPEFEAIFDYIKDDHTGKKEYQLAIKIAKVFDDYQIYRSDMMVNWQNKKYIDQNSDPATVWQRDLWNQVMTDSSQNHLAYKISLFLKQFSNLNIQPHMLPHRISLFGISSLPPIFLQMFEKIAQIIDINLFLLVPSNLYFFDMQSEKQIQKISLKQPNTSNPELLYYEKINPLLSSLGTSGKNFLSFLESFDYYEPLDDLFQNSLIQRNIDQTNIDQTEIDPLNIDQNGTMLNWLQSDILNLIYRKKGQTEPIPIKNQDTSICIHACHSPMREVQVLKDILLKELKNNSDIAPHDIIVLMPDIEAYAPFIESVFSLEKPLGFSISDRKKQSESESLTAFLKILALENGRLEKTQVLDLLLSESIARKFKISIDELSNIEKMASDSGILWGKDATHREKFDLPAFSQNTWQFGLQRLFMGMAMPEKYDGLIEGVLPCDSLEGLDLELLGKFATFCQAVFHVLKLLEKNKSVEQWCLNLTKIVDTLMDQNSNNSEEISFLIQTIKTLKTNSKNANFTDPVSFDVVYSYLKNKLDQNISQGNFLAGNITFCNLMPMRSIPYKIVVLMGMDEKSFPRKIVSPGFDLIKKFPKVGDKNERDEDRYLFLETVLSARSKFIVTYTGMSIQDNTPIPCSSVISELCDTIDQSFEFENYSSYLTFHPLHPFDERYFTSESMITSCSDHNCKIANALRHRSKKKQPFIDTDSFKINEKKSLGLLTDPSLDSMLDSESDSMSDPMLNLALDDMIRFFKNPIQEFMKETLKIKLPDMDELALDREPFMVTGLEQYALGSYLLDQHTDMMNLKDLYPILKGKGILPFGEKGYLEYLRIQSKTEPLIDVNKIILSQTPLPAISTKIIIGDVIVSSTISDIYTDGVYSLSFGKLNGRRLLSSWIRHLFLNITAPEGYPVQTILTGQDPDGKKPYASFSFSPIKDKAKDKVKGKAFDYFTSLTDIYLKGIQSPFCFFCETSWQITKVLEKVEFELNSKNISNAFKKSLPFWQGGFFGPGENHNRYINYCVKDNDPFQNVNTLVDSKIIQNAIQIYQPMLENIERIS